MCQKQGCDEPSVMVSKTKEERIYEFKVFLFFKGDKAEYRVSYCPTCNFWLNILSQHGIYTEDWLAYTLLFSGPKGFDGGEWLITTTDSVGNGEYLNRVAIHDNLWHNGTIPSIWAGDFVKSKTHVEARLNRV